MATALRLFCALAWLGAALLLFTAVGLFNTAADARSVPLGDMFGRIAELRGELYALWAAVLVGLGLLCLAAASILDRLAFVAPRPLTVAPSLASMTPPAPAPAPSSIKTPLWPR